MLAQGNDELYMARLNEYNAYNNWNNAKTQLEDAQGKVAEVEDELPAAEDELSDAQYYLTNANNKDEYEAARKVFDEVKGRVNNLKEKKDTAKVVVDSLVNEVGGLKDTYDTEKEGRKTQRTFIIDNANIDIEEYDPAKGEAPPLPEEADAADAAGDTTSD